MTAIAQRLVPAGGEGALYSAKPLASVETELTALPYHLWANREPGSMQVWITEAARCG